MKTVYVLSIIIIASIIAIGGCKKNSTGSLLQQIQGTWVSACSCNGLAYYQFKGDSIYYSASDSDFTNYGYVQNDTAYIECNFCSPPGIVYHLFPLSLSANGQQLYIGSGCTTSTCTDSSYHKVN